MKNLWYLTGGRPMRKIDKEGFWDNIAQRKVNYYIDKLGKYWIAFHKCSLFRVEIKIK